MTALYYKSASNLFVYSEILFDAQAHRHSLNHCRTGIQLAVCVHDKPPPGATLMPYRLHLLHSHRLCMPVSVCHRLQSVMFDAVKFSKASKLQKLACIGGTALP